jgi:hypothetical protein
MTERQPKYEYLAKTCLLQKRDQLVAQMYRLDYRMEEIKAVKTMIEQDAHVMFGGMTERLKSSEGVKMSYLQHEMAELQKDIDAINELIQEFTRLTTDGVPALDFMVKMPVFKQNIDYLLNKPFKNEIEAVPYDLPRELYEIRKSLEANNQLDLLLQMKDNVIFNVSQTLKNIDKVAVADLETSANREISHWASLSDKYAAELHSYQKICYFCAEPLTEETVNSDCTVNIDKKLSGLCKLRGLKTSQRLHGQGAQG